MNILFDSISDTYTIQQALRFYRMHHVIELEKAKDIIGKHFRDTKIKEHEQWIKDCDSALDKIGVINHTFTTN